MINKTIIVEMFIKRGMTCEQIAAKFEVSIQAIYKVLNTAEEYSRYCENRRVGAENLQNSILNSYYCKRLKVKEVAAINNVSSTYVSRIIKRDSRYEKERLKRKEISKIRHEMDKKKYDQCKRKEDKEVILALMKLQNQDAKEMSIRKKINGDSMIKLNIQHYRYNILKRRLEYDKSSGLLPQGIAATRYDSKY